MSHNKKFDYLIMIGDFAPFNISHQAQLNEALSLANQVIILVNNSFIPRNTDVPFTYAERSYMIKCEINNRVIVAPLFNYVYNPDTWIEQVQDRVLENTKLGDNIGLFTNDQKIIDMFPQWTNVAPSDETDMIADDKAICNLMFAYESVIGIKQFFPPSIYRQLELFEKTDDFKQLLKEYQFIRDYKKAWESAPYTPTFCTSDAVVVQSGHILMIVRGAFPGEGQYALPGGFLEQDETFREGALRELFEETKIDCPRKILIGNIIDEHIFDDPYRSRRGRTVTQATFIKLPDGPLPKVKGSDDAKKAIWIPFSELNSNNVFEDHFSIIHYFLPAIKAI